MTIYLSSGLSVRIDNSQLIQPDKIIATNGSVVEKSSVREVNIISLQSTNEGDMVNLGRQFLSGAYVMLNQDTDTFTLWQANPTTTEALVAVDSKGKVHSSACTATSESTATTTAAHKLSTATAVSEASSVASSSTRLPSGAIAGIAVGGAAALALIAAAAFFCLRRRRRVNRTLLPAPARIVAANIEPPAPGYSGHPGMLQGWSQRAELTGSEKAAVFDYPHEIYTRSMTDTELLGRSKGGMHELGT